MATADARLPIRLADSFVFRKFFVIGGVEGFVGDKLLPTAVTFIDFCGQTHIG
jgi:hypothetical protein